MGAMSLIEQVRRDMRPARKAGDKHTAATLSVLISDATRYDKHPKDGKVIKEARKSVKAIEGFLEIMDEDDEQHSERIPAMKFEKGVYEKYVPQTVSRGEIYAWAKEKYDDRDHPMSGFGLQEPNMGNMMSMLKRHFKDTVDMRVASEVVKEILNGR